MLLLCPLDTGPCLLALTDQEASTDSVMSAGRSPRGALTVAAGILSQDDDYPKGFYLRMVDGRPWLRGYRCSEEYVLGPDDRFVFSLSGRGGRASAGR